MAKQDDWMEKLVKNYNHFKQIVGITESFLYICKT